MSIRIVFLVGVCGLLAGCGGGSQNATSSGFDSFIGGQPATLLINQDDNTVFGPAGTIGYANGFTATGPLEARAVAGIQSENVGTAGTGTATFSGLYAFGVLEDVVLTETEISARDAQSAGNVFLNVDFNTGSLSGTGSSTAGIQSDITVNGSISGRNLSGDVAVNYETPAATMTSLATTLDGFVGVNGAVGVFHGSDANSALAGGFVAQ